MLRRGESSLSTRVRMCGWAGAGVPELSASARADAARACRHVCGVCMCVYVRVRRCAWVGGMGLGGLRRSGQERRWQVWRCSLRLEGCCTVVARSRGRVRVRGSLEVRASDRGSSLIVMCVVWYGNWVYILGIRGEDPPSRLSPKIRISLNSLRLYKQQAQGPRAPPAPGRGGARGHS